MRKYVNRFLAISMAGMMAFSITACTGTSSSQKTEETTEESVGMANPITECTEDELVEKTGIDLPAPSGAEDVTYSYIDYQSDDKDEDGTLIAQMNFTLDDKPMFLRACMTSITDLNDLQENAKAEDIEGFDFTKGNISGLYYEWTTKGTAVVQERDALMNLTEEDGGVGYIAWVDVVPGILYNLGIQENATDKNLPKYADKIFVPMQGESYGDEETSEFTEQIQKDYMSFLDGLDTYTAKESAKTLEDFVSKYGDKISLQSMESICTDLLGEMNKEDNEDNCFSQKYQGLLYKAHKQCLKDDSDLETDVAYNQVVNATMEILNELDEASKVEKGFKKDNEAFLKAFNSLLDDIYETRAGSAGSSTRVEKAAKKTEKLVSTYADHEGCLEDVPVRALAKYKYTKMMENDEDFIDNYTEELDAMQDAVTSKEAKALIKSLKLELEIMNFN